MDPIFLTKMHSGIAILVILSYVIRGGLMLSNSAVLRSIIFTAINHSLVLLLVFLGSYTTYTKGLSFSSGFIISKLCCLLLFVLLGGVALKQGLSKSIAIILWLLGLASITYAWMLGKHVVPAFF